MASCAGKKDMNGIDHRQMKLGKKSYVHDHRTLHLARYLTPAKLPPVPAVIDYTKSVPEWGMDANDRVGDCTCASIDHCEKLWFANAGVPFASTEQDVLALYSKITGYNPADPSTDNGAELIDCLKYWQQNGYLGHKILAYAKVDPTNAEMMKAALFLFECLYAGVNLPWTAQDQEEWTVTDPTLKGDAAPASWGGHAIPLVKYDEKGWTCVTWGALMPMTDEFLTTYCDEVWAVVTEDVLMRATQKSPGGFDMNVLAADMQIVQG